MDQSIIDNWNNTVSRKDTVYILGDFAWKNHLHYIGALKSHKILLLGNHDRASKTVYGNLTAVHDILQKEFNKRLMIMCHYPMRSWNGRVHGSWMLHGHCHCKLSPMRNTIDVGCDGNNYLPYSLDDIFKKMADNNAKFDIVKKCFACGNTEKWVTTADEERCGVCGSAL